jgi:hypothetical protein
MRTKLHKILKATTTLQNAVVAMFTLIPLLITRFFIEPNHQNQARLTHRFLSFFFGFILTYFYFRAMNLLTLQRWHDETRLIFASLFSLFWHIVFAGVIIAKFYEPGCSLILKRLRIVIINRI